MGLFDPNNGLFRTLSRMVDVVGLSLVWLLLCLPVVTIGPATAALYHTVAAVLYDKEDAVFLRYYRSFKENLKVGIPAGIICLAVGFLLVLGFEIMYAHRATGLQALTYAMYYIAMILPLGTVCYLFPLLGRFMFSLKNLFITAFQMTLAHLPTTVIVVLLVLQGGVFMVNHIWSLFFLPAVLTGLVSLFLERVFRKHIPKEE